MESVQTRRSFDADWQRQHDLQLTRTLLIHDPITGYGMEDIATSAPPTKAGGFKLPHSVPLQSWVAGGLFALMGTLWLYGVALWSCVLATRSGFRWGVGLLAACCAFIVMDVFHPSLNQRFKWLAVAIVIASLQSPKSSVAIEPPNA